MAYPGPAADLCRGDGHVAPTLSLIIEPMWLAVRVLLALCFAALLASCTSTDNLFNTGRDARIYNPRTGRYEWPDRN